MYRPEETVIAERRGAVSGDADEAGRWRTRKQVVAKFEEHGGASN
jgi:hypothetical protein